MKPQFGDNFKFSQREEEALGNLAISMETDKGVPDVQAAYELIYGGEGVLETNRTRWIDSKRGAFSAPLGSTIPADQKPQNARASGGLTKAAPASTPVMESRAVAARQDDLSIATTVTGCLDLRDDGMFQLKDTDGDHTPKARSWKSGFIKKAAAKIDVFDAGNRLKLGNHVGYRVTLSGMLTDRQLRARSLESTSESCR